METWQSAIHFGERIAAGLQKPRLKSPSDQSAY